jgi:hypothetical protein
MRQCGYVAVIVKMVQLDVFIINTIIERLQCNVITIVILPDFIENCLTCQIHASAVNTDLTHFEHNLTFTARVKKELVSPN